MSLSLSGTFISRLLTRQIFKEEMCNLVYEALKLHYCLTIVDYISSEAVCKATVCVCVLCLCACTYALGSSTITIWGGRIFFSLHLIDEKTEAQRVKASNTIRKWQSRDMSHRFPILLCIWCFFLWWRIYIMLEKRSDHLNLFYLLEPPLSDFYSLFYL